MHGSSGILQSAVNGSSCLCLITISTSHWYPLPVEDCRLICGYRYNKASSFNRAVWMPACRQESLTWFHPLCTLNCCPTLTTLSLISAGDLFSSGNANIWMLSQLQSLTSLTLQFRNTTVCTVLWPLSGLSRLQQLSVEGLVPIDPGSVHGNFCALPASLTSVFIKGHGEHEAPFFCFVNDWTNHVPRGNCIQKLTFQLCRMGPEDRHAAGFERLSTLRELSFIRYPSPEVNHMELVQLPACLSSVTTLEVLRVGTIDSKMPWHQHYGEMRTLQPLLRNGCRLRELDKVRPCRLDEAAVRGLRHLTKLGLWAIYDDVPGWLVGATCPELKHLVLEMSYVSQQDVQQISTLRQLTHLRLDVGEVGVDFGEQQQFWATLDLLAHSLSSLVRLEIVTWGLEESRWVTLGLPGLGAFTQIKQLQVVRVMDDDHNVGPPSEPSSAELLQGLSQLTQLEVLELEGYSTITPGLVLGLAAALLKVRRLQIGLCKHPRLWWEKYRVSDLEDPQLGVGDGEWDVVHPGFSDVGALCSQLRTELQVEIGFARQWLHVV